MEIRSRALLLALVAGLCVNCGRVTGGAATAAPHAAPRAAAPAPQAPATAAAAVDFQTQARPILQARCSPCHFEGGQMYEELPFDRPETIRELGARLFTRIKDEHEQAVLRSFFSKEAPEGTLATSGP